MRSGADDHVFNDRLDGGGKRHGGKKPSAGLGHATLPSE
jgi:hypothetical protein